MDALKNKVFNRLSTCARPQTVQERRKSGKKRLLTERELPSQLDVLIPESRVYSKLLKFEQRLDASIARKHIELQEALNAGKVQQNVILRVLIYNEYHDQAFETETDNPEDPPGWTLRIQGQVLDKDTLAPSKNHKLAFSNFLQKMVVQLDPRHYKGTNSTIVWRKDTAVAVSDGFEIRRRGEGECDCKISIWLDHAPPQYQVAKPLDKLIGVDTANMDTILSALWEYIKENELQDEESPTKTTIKMNKDLQKVFGRQSIEMSDLVKELRCHLRPPDPVVFKYRVRLSGDINENAECYDFDLPCPDRFSTRLNLNNNPQDRQGRPSTQHFVENSKLETKISEIVAETHEHLRRREFLMAFADSPVNIINLLLTSQHNDLKTAERSKMGLPGSLLETGSEVFQQEWVPDAVDRYLRTLQPNEDEYE